MQSSLKHLQGWFSQVPSNPNYSIVLRFLSFLSFSSSSAGIANLLLLLYLNYIFMIHKNIIYLNTYCFYILKMYFGIYLYILSLDFRYDISGQKHFLAFWLLCQDIVDLAQPGLHQWHWHGRAEKHPAQGCLEPQPKLWGTKHCPDLRHPKGQLAEV